MTSYVKNLKALKIYQGHRYIKKNFISKTELDGGASLGWLNNSHTAIAACELRAPASSGCTDFNMYSYVEVFEIEELDYLEQEPERMTQKYIHTYIHTWILFIF